jgi:hypothetical protein
MAQNPMTGIFAGILIIADVYTHFFLPNTYEYRALYYLSETRISNLMLHMKALQPTIVRLNIEIIELVSQLIVCTDPFSEVQYFGSPMQICLLQEKTDALQKTLEQHFRYYTECKIRMELMSSILIDHREFMKDIRGIGYNINILYIHLVFLDFLLLLYEIIFNR